MHNLIDGYLVFTQVNPIFSPSPSMSNARTSSAQTLLKREEQRSHRANEEKTTEGITWTRPYKESHAVVLQLGENNFPIPNTKRSNK